MPQFKLKDTDAVHEASQWFKNGDHPGDYADETEGMIDGVQRRIPGNYRRERGWEGTVVRYFRHPDVPGTSTCELCGLTMHEHGWIEGGSGEGPTVCPGSWIVTTSDGKQRPLDQRTFERLYEPVAA